jgi:uncharacterized membrane protein YgcG
MDRAQVLQVKPGSDAASLHLGKWYCTGKDYGRTRYLQRNGDWGDAAFYFNSESEVKSTLTRNHPSATVSHEEPQESFTPSRHESHDDDDSSNSFGLGSIGGLLDTGGSLFSGGGGDFGGGGAGGDW